MLLNVGRVGRAHGVRGEVSVEVRSDSPELRFAPGSTLLTSPQPGSLTVQAARWHSGRLLVSFVGITDREGAEAVRGQLLRVDSDSLEELSDPDEFYDHQLVDLVVVTRDGAVVGVVTEVMHGAGGETLVVSRSDTADSVLDDSQEQEPRSVARPTAPPLLIPFVMQIVPEVDLVGKRIVLDPPAGLLDL